MRHLFRTAAGLTVAMSASMSLAQDAVKPPITVRKSQAPAVQRESQKVPEVAPAAPAASNQQGEDSRTTRVSDLLGTDLVLEDGNSLGKVSDLIIDNRNGSVAYVIVETDQDYRPVPWKALAMYQGQPQAQVEGQAANQSNVTDQYFVIGMDRDRFMQSPSISRNDYQTFSTSAPDKGLSSKLALLISATKSLSFIVAVKASRKTFKRSFGVPGGKA